MDSTTIIIILEAIEHITNLIEQIHISIIVHLAESHRQEGVGDDTWWNRVWVSSES
jgi:hypothetical protein